LNMTVEQVANQLNLAPRQIQALEADNYGALPGLASVRGFIRAYAKLVKIDAEPLVQAIANEVTPTSVEPLGPALSNTPFSDGRSSLAGRGFPLKWLIAIAVAGGLLIVALIGQQLGWLPSLTQSISLKIDKGMTLLPGAGPQEAASETAGADKVGEKSSSSPTVVVSEVPVTVPASKPEPAPVAKAEPAPVAKAEPAPAAKAEPVPVAKVEQVVPAKPPVPQAAAVPVVAPVAEASKAPPAIDPAAKDMLVLKIREDSWIDIRRRDNSAVLSRLVKAGETEAIKVTGTLAVTVGNAAGVDATLRGKAVELPTEAKSNVARLTLK
jgi:cytoskeleton protein RodZ